MNSSTLGAAGVRDSSTFSCCLSMSAKIFAKKFYKEGGTFRIFAIDTLFSCLPFTSILGVASPCCNDDITTSKSAYFGENPFLPKNRLFATSFWRPGTPLDYREVDTEYPHISVVYATL